MVENFVVIATSCYILHMLSCCDYCHAGESSFEIKTEDESIDVSESPRDAKSHPLACRLSDERFAVTKSLDEPIRVCSGPKSFSCPQCEKRFRNKQSLRTHMNIHSCRFKCSECGKCFQQSSGLTIHKRIHSGEKPFECSVCGKRFTSAGYLRTHNRIHSGEKPFKCQVCQKSFITSALLNIHMRVHTGEKPYICSICNKSFRQSSTL